MPREANTLNPDPATYRALIHPPGARCIEVIDQRALPHALVKVTIGDAEAAALAIRRMWIRGAPLIGAVGAYGLALALDRVRAKVLPLAVSARADAAWAEADAIAAEDIEINFAIGEHGLALLRNAA